jgi:serine/threonine protein kinase
MSSYIEICADEHNNVYYITKVLAQGGQGIVYRTRDADTAVKFVTDNNGNIIDPKHAASYQEKFRKLRFLPVPDDANITFPAALLSKQAGYVMHFLNGMSPVSGLCINAGNSADINEEEIPEWLKGMPDSNAAKQFSKYCKTGGLRRRLHVLYKISSQLAILHGVGLVYGDISGNNIFITDDKDNFITDDEDNFSVWFIDADNLKYEGAYGAVYTPRYGAPELVQERGPGTMASDCHAFAVLAYIMLTMTHPFIGEKVTGEASDWADTNDNNEDPEARALAGYYPWVRDKDDDSNRSSDGLPPELLFNEEIDVLFQETFGKGRIDPKKRPAIFHWPLAFAQAADSAIQCPGCRMSYRYDYTDADTGAEQCPYCEKPAPAFVLLESYAWEDGTIGKKQWVFAREFGISGTIRLPARIFSLFPLAKGDIPAMELEINETSVLFKKYEDLGIDFSIAARNTDQGKYKKLSSQIRFEFPSDFAIFAAADGFSRIIFCAIKNKGGGYSEFKRY